MDEIVDILDENGQKTGQTKLKNEVHKDGSWHRAVHIWIVNDEGAVLIQKRSLKKLLSPGLWDVSVGGHVSAGEESLKSALREIEEEIGLSVGEHQLEYLFEVSSQSSRNNNTIINNEFVDVYLLNLNLDVSNLSIQEEEVDEVKFISFLEFEKMVQNKDASIVNHEKEYAQLFEILHACL